MKANEPCFCDSGRKYKRCHRPSFEPVRPASRSGPRPVPSQIERPDYAEDGEPKLLTEPLVKTAAQIAAMRRAGRIAAEVLTATGAAVAPGITTDELDAIAHEECVRRGAYPSPLNYRGYPKSICTSVNEVICHGIPDSRPLVDGDIVNLDVTVFIDGVHGDTNATFLVGSVDAASRSLVATTAECLDLAIAAVRPGGRLSDVGAVIEQHAVAAGFSVVRSYVGHGIGAVFHNQLAVPHYFDPRATTVFTENMTFTIEPMLNAGTFADRSWPDGWTAVTADGSRSAQFEHTLVVTPTGAEVLTRTALS